MGIEAGVEEVGCHGLRRSLFWGMRLMSTRARRKRKAKEQRGRGKRHAEAENRCILPLA